MMINEGILRLLEAKERGSLKYQAKCPCHDDRKESLFISWHGNGELFFHCHAGCDWKDIKTTLNYTRQMQEATQTQKRLEKTYVYKDEQGNPVFRKLRYEGKQFFIESLHDGKWQKGLNGCRKLLYRLPETLKAIESLNGVFFVEGEKDADTLIEKMQITSTTLFDGAGGNLNPDLLMPLKGGSIILCGDNDEPGRWFINRLKEALAPIVKKLAQVKVPENFKDVTDWINAGANKDDIRKVISPVGLVKVRPYSLDELLTMSIARRKRLVGGWLLEGSSILLAGGAGAGKSMLVHYLAYCLASGNKCMEWEVESCPVAILDGEMAIEEIQNRLLEIGRTLPFHQGMTPRLDIICKDNFLKKKQPLPNLRNALERIALYEMIEGTKVLVVDNLNIFFAGKDENTPDFWVDVEKMVFECNERGITPILIHHSPKSNPDAPAGSSKNERVAEVIMMVGRVPHNDEDTGIFSNIKFRKVRHFSKDIQPFSFKVKYFQGCSYFEKHPYIEPVKLKD